MVLILLLPQIPFFPQWLSTRLYILSQWVKTHNLSHHITSSDRDFKLPFKDLHKNKIVTSNNFGVINRHINNITAKNLKMLSLTMFIVDKTILTSICILLGWYWLSCVYPFKGLTVWNTIFDNFFCKHECD